MDISDQTVREHYSDLLGLGKEWLVERVDADHAKQRLEAWAGWNPKRKLRCPSCERACPGYDSLPQRTWRHLDACGYLTLVHARIPRCRCPKHGVGQVRVPWAEPGSRFTLAFERHAIEVLLAARSLSDGCKLLRIDWSTAHRIQQRSVQRGLERRAADPVRYVGLDEKSFGRGQHYGTIMSDLEGKRVLEVVEHRREEDAREAIESLPEPVRAGIEAVALDMWQPFVSAVRAALPQAAVVHDKFHVMKMLGGAVDKVRKAEHRALRAEGDETLTGRKYLFLKNPENFSPEQEADFKTLLSLELKVGRAWNLRQLFAHLWDFVSQGHARGFFQKWFVRTKRSKLPPMKSVADTLKRHEANILTYFTHRITNATAEGLNSLIQALKANARGFRSFANFRISILFHLGRLHLYP